MYAHGKVVSVDHAMAFKYDKLAADQGLSFYVVGALCWSFRLT
jgi:TPR repeat protein